jgi:hypothetical protein
VRGKKRTVKGERIQETRFKLHGSRGGIGKLGTGKLRKVGEKLPIDFQWMNTERDFNTKDFSYFRGSE